MGGIGVLCLPIIFFFMNEKSHGGLGKALHGLIPSIDGTYTAEAPGGGYVRLYIAGSDASYSAPQGISEEGIKVEQHGATLKFSGGVMYKNGYIDQVDEGPPELATIADDGQSIIYHMGNYDLKLIKQ